MPRGKFTSHKGRNRKFTNPEELEEQRRRDEQQKKWRKEHNENSSEEEEEVAASSSKDKRISEEDGSGSESNSEDESSSEDEGKKAKGVSNLIEIENPNWIQKKSKKLNSLNTDVPPEKPELSRREREEIGRQKAYAQFQKLHAEGKTEQARVDLARLAIIKQQREEALKRREEEKKAKADAAKQKTAQIQKALGKK